MIKALTNYVIIEPIIEQEKKQTSNGILVASSNKETPSKGVVKDVRARYTSAGVPTDTEISEGDIVYFKKYSTYVIKSEDRELYIVEMPDVMAIES